MVIIRLARGGTVKRPFYHVVVTDRRSRARRPLHRAHRVLQPDRDRRRRATPRRSRPRRPLGGARGSALGAGRGSAQAVPGDRRQRRSAFGAPCDSAVSANTNKMGHPRPRQRRVRREGVAQSAVLHRAPRQHRDVRRLDAAQERRGPRVRGGGRSQPHGRQRGREVARLGRSGPGPRMGRRRDRRRARAAARRTRRTSFIGRISKGSRFEPRRDWCSARSTICWRRVRTTCSCSAVRRERLDSVHRRTGRQAGRSGDRADRRRLVAGLLSRRGCTGSASFRCSRSSWRR